MALIKNLLSRRWAPRIKSGPASYSISNISSNGLTTNTILKGFPIEITVNTKNIGNTTLYYTLTGSLSTDIIGGATSGTVTIINNVGIVSILTVADNAYQANKTFTFQLRTGSTSGTIVATSSTLTLTYAPSTNYTPISLFMVGGGGGGGSDFGGGGGGGAVFSIQKFFLRQNYISVSIAAGGSRGQSQGFRGSVGGVTSFQPVNDSRYITNGGGGGGTFSNNSGLSGGNGGGGGGTNCGGGSGGLGGAAGENTSYYSNGYIYTGSIGDSGFSGGNYGGGGGGMTGAGGSNPGGFGGPGRFISITNSSYGAGGGGGSCGGGTLNNGGSNGIGGSGAGAAGVDNATTFSTPGQTNSGSGGGGGGATGGNASLGGNGGSGIIILKMLSTTGLNTYGGTTTNLISDTGGYKIYTITAGSGNVMFA